MKDRKLAKGIWRTKYGWRLYVWVAGRQRPKRVRDVDHRFTLAELKEKRDEFRVAERKAARLPPPSTPGTFAEDVRAKYLPAVKALPSISERTYHMGVWIREFGERSRDDVQPWEIAKVRDRWLTEGPKRVCVPWPTGERPAGATTGKWIDVAAPLSASQVNSRMRALQNFYTVLNGRHGYNPAREAGEAREPESTPRALSYDVVEAILAQMRDERRGRKLTVEQSQAVARAAAQRGANLSAIARQFTISETMVRKIARRGPRDTDEIGLTKLRLRVMAYTGFSQGELAGITETDLHLEDASPWVWIKGRRKGKGTSGTAQPLSERGAAALRALAAAGGLGAFSVDSMGATFERACRKLGLKGLRPYDLRHTFATEVFEKTGGNLSVTQQLMRHRDPRTTLIYGKKAINVVGMAAIKMVESQGGFRSKDDR